MADARALRFWYPRLDSCTCTISDTMMWSIRGRMPVIHIAIKNIVRQRRRSLVALVAVVCGIASLIVAGGFIEWNLSFGRESTIHSQLGHIRVFKPGYLDAGAANPFAYLLRDNPEQLRFLESQPHVKALAPRLSINGLISHGDSTISFIGEGVSPDREIVLSQSLTIVQGEQLSPADRNGIIIGEGLAANLGLAPGDKVVLLVTTAKGGDRRCCGQSSQSLPRPTPAVCPVV